MARNKKNVAETMLSMEMSLLNSKGELIVYSKQVKIIICYQNNLKII